MNILKDWIVSLLIVAFLSGLTIGLLIANIIVRLQD